jgi:hypothetical protein
MNPPPQSSREATPEPYIIPSQYRLQQVIEMDDPTEQVPEHILHEYQSRGHMLLTEEGKAMLAAPMKQRR